MSNIKAYVKNQSADTVQNMVVLLIFLSLCTVLAIVEPTFLSMANFSNILIQISSVVIVASAVSMVVISGNLDLSVGAIGAMAGVAYALLARAGIPISIAILLSLLFGLAFGGINGFLVSKLRLPSFIITMATMYIARGIAYIGAEGAVITTGLPGNFGNIGSGSLGPLYFPVLYMFIIFGIFVFLQNKTVWAKKIYAIGSNIKAAELSGISIVKNVVIAFGLVGLLSAFAGVVVTARFAQADCKILMNLHFDVIIACVLGGTDVNGGKGTVVGMIIGAAIVGVLSNVLNMLGMTIYFQDVVKGLVLVAAIAMNRKVRDMIKG